jgi:MFS family permease
MKQKAVAPLFYFGILISSIGSGAFGTALFSFLILNNFSLAQAALLLGLQRLIPTFVVAISGHWTDRLSARATIIAAEVIAAFLSLALILVWHGQDSSLFLIGVLSIARTVIVFFQLGSRAKISKILSGDSFQGNSRHAMWLNKATQGGSLFSGVLAWAFVTYGTLEGAILFDFVTFVLNGLIVFLLPRLANSVFLADSAEVRTVQAAERERWFEKFRAYFMSNRQLMYADIALFVATGGLIAYGARIAGNQPGWAGLFVAAYGLAVWVAGFMERSVTSKLSVTPFWIGIGLSYLVMGQAEHATLFVVGVSFVKDFCFWVIFHRVSARLQMRTPVRKMGSVTSARSVLIVVLSAGAEILVGAWSNVVSLPLESAVRAGIAMTVGIYVTYTIRAKRSVSRANLENVEVSVGATALPRHRLRTSPQPLRTKAEAEQSAL